MCKPFPPPLVRGGVFLVGSGTKYRDIADGNFRQKITTHSVFYGGQVPSTAILRMETPKPAQKVPPRPQVRYQVPRYCGWKLDICQLLSDAVVLSDTKYRDIADGNVIPNTQDGAWAKLETKYRDIADGNYQGNSSYTSFAARVRYQVPRYSGWKH